MQYLCLCVLIAEKVSFDRMPQISVVLKFLICRSFVGRFVVVVCCCRL